MATTQIDLLLAAIVGLLYVLFVFVRVLRLRGISRLFRLLINVPVVIFPVVGATTVHLAVCVIVRRPRDVRSLGVLGLAGSCGTLLAYALASTHIAVQDAYGVSFILLGMLAFPTLGSFVLFVGIAVAKGQIATLLPAIPKWALLLAALIVVNAVIHLGVYSKSAEYGVPRERSGSYYLEINDRPIRKITEGEYFEFSGHLVRGTSSLLLAFFLVPALFYLRCSQGPPDAAEGDPSVAAASPRGLDAL